MGPPSRQPPAKPPARKPPRPATTAATTTTVSPPRVVVTAPGADEDGKPRMDSVEEDMNRFPTFKQAALEDSSSSEGAGEPLETPERTKGSELGAAVARAEAAEQSKGTRGVKVERKTARTPREPGQLLTPFEVRSSSDDANPFRTDAEARGRQDTAPRPMTLSCVALVALLSLALSVLGLVAVVVAADREVNDRDTSQLRLLSAEALSGGAFLVFVACVVFLDVRLKCQDAWTAVVMGTFWASLTCIVIVEALKNSASNREDYLDFPDDPDDAALDAFLLGAAEVFLCSALALALVPIFGARRDPFTGLHTETTAARAMRWIELVFGVPLLQALFCRAELSGFEHGSTVDTLDLIKTGPTLGSRRRSLGSSSGRRLT